MIGAILALVATGTKGFELVAVLCWIVTILIFVGLRTPSGEPHAHERIELDSVASPHDRTKHITAAAPRVPKARQAVGGLSISADA